MRWNPKVPVSAAVVVAVGVCLTFIPTRSTAQSDPMAVSTRVPGPTADTELRRELAARVDSMLTAFRRDDVQGIARIFADDGTILGPQGARVQGRAAIDRYWHERARPTTWVIETIDAGGSREAPWQYARSIRTTVANGVVTRTVTTFVLIWKRDASGVLRIFLDLYTAPVEAGDTTASRTQSASHPSWCTRVGSCHRLAKRWPTLPRPDRSVLPGR